MTSIRRVYKQIILTLERVQRSLICFLLYEHVLCSTPSGFLCLLKLLMKFVKCFVVESYNVFAFLYSRSFHSYPGITI